MLEAEIGKFEVLGQRGQKVCKSPSAQTKTGAPVTPAMAGNINRRIEVQVSQGKKRDPLSKIARAKGERHGSSDKALSSKPQSTPLPNNHFLEYVIAFITPSSKI
jgi:hypothetical protein